MLAFAIALHVQNYLMPCLRASRQQLVVTLAIQKADVTITLTVIIITTTVIVAIQAIFGIALLELLNVSNHARIPLQVSTSSSEWL